MRRAVSLVCLAATVALSWGMVSQAQAGSLPIAVICGSAALLNAFLAGALSDVLAEEKRDEKPCGEQSTQE